MSDETSHAEVPASGQDPDSKQRLAKTLAAAGVDVPEGLSVDPITDEDRAKAREVHDEFVEAAEKRREAAEGKPEARTAAPAGRSTKAEARGATADKKG